MALREDTAWAGVRLIRGRRIPRHHLRFPLRRSHAWLCIPLLVGVMLPMVLSGCASTVSRRQSPPPILALPTPRPPTGQFGAASWYGPGFHGNPTASGEIYNQHALTAAHPTLPLGTRVQVTNLANGKSMQVRITDRGPFVRGRAIDLSRGAAKKLGMVKAGLSRVRIRPLSASQAKGLRASPPRSQRERPVWRRRVRPPQPQESPQRKLFVLDRRDGEGSVL
ncbi:MAG TPA: septal ring lytic transglycosylase RlpA family protein [Candidatus Binatia bacterium]|nr:septal ring lytic transglycosylase RlpA family protein [Candidatus Binatia bacterium]